jgi:PAS domain S-box-containing protein
MGKRKPRRAITPRRKSTANLRGQELYRSLVEASMDAVTMTDLEGRITYASPRTLELHGFDRPGELLGRSALDIVAPEERERAARNLRKTLAEDRSGNVQYTLLRKDGSRFVGEINAAVVRDARGRPTRFIATVRDITDRTRAEDALRQNEAMLRLIADQIPISIWTVNRELRITSTLGAGPPGSGLGPPREMGLTLMEVFGGLHHSAVGAHRLALIGESETYEFEREGRAYRGRAEPLRDREGTIIGAISIMTEVTEEKQQTAALLKREGMYRSLFENLAIGVYRTTEVGRILWANPAMARILGFESVAELMKANAYDLYARESDRIDLMRKLRAAKVLTVETEARRRDGRTIWIRDYIRAILDEGGGVAYLEGALVEIPAKTALPAQT